MARFTGRNVFVTGAGSGFGQRTAELFAIEGARNVYLVDRLPERLEAAAERVAAAGANPVSICCDLGDMANCAAAVEQALALLGPVLSTLLFGRAATPELTVFLGFGAKLASATLG